jgi:3-oxoacyl-[acyl-carrier-protein] synthase III
MRSACQNENEIVMTKRAFLSSIALQIGRVVEVEPGSQTIVSGDAINHLHERGLTRFLQEERDPVDVWSTCASDSINMAGLSVNEVDVVLLSNVLPEPDVGFRMLQQTGIGKAQLLKLAMQDCGACSSVVAVASAMVCESGRAKRLLGLVSWYGSAPGSSRIGPNGDTLFGDGTVSFIISNVRGDFEILATEQRAEPDLFDLERDSAKKSNYLLASLDNLQSTAERALGAADIKVSDLRAVFCTNANSVFQDAIGLATSTNDIIYRKPLMSFGHVLACDELLGLKTYQEENLTHAGDTFLLVAWGPYTASACVLKQCSDRK